VFLALIIMAVCFGKVETATASGPNALVINTSSYYDDRGWLTVVGEIQNTGDVALADVTVLIEVRDSQGQTSRLSNTPQLSYSSSGVLEVNERIPFRCQWLLFREWGPYTYAIDGVTYKIAEGKPHILAIDMVSEYTDQSGFFHLTGYVENTSPTGFGAFGVRVTATFYGSDGAVVAVGTTTLQDFLSANGGRGFFDVRVDDYDRGQIPLIASWSLYASSIEYNMVPEFPSVFIALSATFSMGLGVVSVLRRRTKSSC